MAEGWTAETFAEYAKIADNLIEQEREKVKKMRSLISKYKKREAIQREIFIDEFMEEFIKIMRVKIFLIDPDMVKWFEEHIITVAERVKNGQKELS